MPNILSVPHPAPAPENAAVAQERGMIWAPRGIWARRNNDNSDDTITITETEEEQLTVIQQGQEIELTKLVEKRVTVIDQKKVARDNVRKNHFKNKNSGQVCYVFRCIYD